MKKILIHILLVTSFIINVNNGFSFNRWFKVSPGIRIAGIAVDMDSRVPDNYTTTRFDYGGGINFDIQLEKHLGLDFELLYIRKGAAVSSPGSQINLEYLSIPMLMKFWISRKQLAAVFGPVHNILIGSSGTLYDPNVKLSSSNTNFYDLGLGFGINYVLYTFKNGMRLMGDFRFEIGLMNVYKEFRPELFNRTTPYLAFGLNF